MQLCQRFNPSLELKQIQLDFQNIQGDPVQICNQLEQFLINDDEKYITAESNSEQSKDIRNQIISIGQKIKASGMELSRGNTQEFNDFIKAALGEWVYSKRTELRSSKQANQTLI